MAIPSIAESDRGARGGASESSPLLSNNVEAVDALSHRRRRAILLLYAFAFTMMLGDNLQPAALIEIFENLICNAYYKEEMPLDEVLGKRDCKVQPVQKELALVRGLQQFVPLIPALLCTVPYGLLAERIGRRRVLILSGVGVFAALSWVMAVCYWQFVGIRWVLLSGIFLFIGGGDAVTSSLVHIMVTDATSQAERAQVFLNLHAADVLSGFFGPAISAPLMEKGYTWSALLLAQIMLFTGTFIITYFIPETLELRDKSAQHADSAVDVTSSESHALPAARSDSFIATIRHVVRKACNSLVLFFRAMTSNRQALLLLIIFAPQTAARELFSVIGLQYSGAKYSLPYARGNVLLSLFQGAQGILVLFLLPAVTRTVADPRGWTAWARDRRYAVVSIAVTAAGLMTIGLAPALAVEGLGLLLVALGSCTTGLVMSLLGGAVRPDQVSTFYSVALTLSMITRSVTGPVLSALLVKGLELGREWLGLPFIVMAILMIIVTVASSHISAEKLKDDHEE